jgi:AraC-like DNA-binding protein
MARSIPSPISAETFLAETRAGLTAMIEQAERGVLTVRIPTLSHVRGRHTRMHFHLRPEVNLLFAGGQTVQTPAGNVHCPARSALLLPPGVPHVASLRSNRSAEGRLFVVQFGTLPARIHLAGPGPNHRPFCLHAMRVENPELIHAERYIQSAVHLAATRSTGYRKAIQGMMLAHLGTMLDLLRRQAPSPREEHPKIARCKELIVTSLADETLSVGRLASWVGVTPDYLSHLFVQETGTTISRYINQWRVSLARDLLAREPQRNISEIAHAVGYADPGYFTRVFRQWMGQSPRSLRRQLAAGVPASRDSS